MSDEKKEGRSFIHEKIVPRRKYKKILMAVFGTLGLALLFGAVAGLTFFVSQNVLGANAETPAPTIVIARDDTSEEETAEESTKPVQPETPEESASEAESTVPDGGEKEPEDTQTSEETQLTEEPQTSEESSESTKESPEETTGGNETAAETTAAPNTKKPENSVKTVYDKVSGGIVPVTIRKSGGLDWFNKEIFERVETFAVLFAQSEEDVFALMESENGMENASITLTVNGEEVPGTVYQQDNLQHLCVLKIDRQAIQGTPQLVALGDSTSLIVADDVFVAGAPMGKVVGVDGGIITYYGAYEDVIDGYEQLFYTNMVRVPGGNAALLNRYGQLVGWVSDASCGADGTTVIARGLSPMKYLIEDMCSGADTGYLGVRCIPVTAADEEAFGTPAGLYVQDVMQDSPAYLAGMQTGDRLTSFNGKSVTDSRVLQRRLDEMKAEDTVMIGIERYNGDEYVPMVIKATLGRR